MQNVNHVKISHDEEGVLVQFFEGDELTVEWVAAPVHAIGIARELMQHALLADGLQESGE